MKISVLKEAMEKRVYINVHAPMMPAAVTSMDLAPVLRVGQAFCVTNPAIMAHSG